MPILVSYFVFAQNQLFNRALLTNVIEEVPECKTDSLPFKLLVLDILAHVGAEKSLGRYPFYSCTRIEMSWAVSLRLSIVRIGETYQGSPPLSLHQEASDFHVGLFSFLSPIPLELASSSLVKTRSRASFSSLLHLLSFACQALVIIERYPVRDTRTVAYLSGF